MKPRFNKQTNNFKLILQYTLANFLLAILPGLMMMLHICVSLSKTKIGTEYNMKKVLCSAEKSSVIWAEPHGRSSAEQLVVKPRFNKQTNNFKLIL